jgi:hypothetical protein
VRDQQDGRRAGGRENVADELGRGLLVEVSGRFVEDEGGAVGAERPPSTSRCLWPPES